MAQDAKAVIDDRTGGARTKPAGRRHSAREVRLLPPTYLPMTAEQENQAIEALAGLLAEAEQRRGRREGSVRPAP